VSDIVEGPTSIEQTIAEIHVARAEADLAQRRRVRRMLGVLVTLVVVAGLAYGVDRVWFGPPDLRVGSRHHVTLTFRPPKHAAANVAASWSVGYAGYRWCSYQPPFGADPVSGTFLVVAKAPADPNFPEPNSDVAPVAAGHLATFTTSGHTLTLYRLAADTGRQLEC
jgi:hypothetical protein